jgi:hypothetical protein
MMFYALEDVIERSPGELIFGKFAHVPKAFFTVEFEVAGDAYEPDKGFDLFGSEWLVFAFH